MSTGVAKDSNPLVRDKKLKSLLQDVDSINTVEEFDQWRKSFLSVYTKYLDKKETGKAELACAKLSTTSKSLKKVVKRLGDYIEKGTLSQDQVAVRANTCLSELKATLMKLAVDIEKLLPSTEHEIQAFGFSKWHMGAVLVRDGFKEYAILMHSVALLRQMRVLVLDDVADRQLLDEIAYFEKKFKVLCGVLADLGLMPACQKATQVLFTKLLREAHQAETAAKQLEREKLSMSRHSSTGPKKKLDVSRYAAFSGKNAAVADDESSYESIEELVTISSYESMELSDDSSYETVVVEAESEYETDEEEIEVSEYETDSDFDNDQKPTPRGQGRRSQNRKLGKRLSRSPKKKMSKSAAHSCIDIKKSGCVAKSSAVRCTSGNSSKDRNKREEKADKIPEQDESEQEEESYEESDSDISSSSEDTPPPKKYGRTKPCPKIEPNPDPNYDPYAPTQRMKWTLKDYYPNYNANMFKNRRNKEKDQAPDPPKEKTLRRVVHTETIKTRRKLEKPPPTRIRIKKEKPHIKVQVRRERKVLRKTRVKKNKGLHETIPKDIIVVQENLKPPKSPTKSVSKSRDTWPFVSPIKPKKEMGDSLTTMETMESSCTSLSSLNIY